MSSPGGQCISLKSSCIIGSMQHTASREMSMKSERCERLLVAFCTLNYVHCGSPSDWAHSLLLMDRYRPSFEIKFEFWYGAPTSRHTVPRAFHPVPPWPVRGAFISVKPARTGYPHPAGRLPTLSPRRLRCDATRRPSLTS